MNWKQAIAPYTMVKGARVDNLVECIHTINMQGIEGDLIETGVWKGGMCMLMAALGGDRRVYVADSFRGLPPPDPQYEADKGDKHHKRKELAVSRGDVEAGFKRLGLMDKKVVYLEGWFKDTLPGPVEKLAILRLDGDMYGSTMEALEALYDKLVPGGFCIIDDYGAVKGCRYAVTDFRWKHKITEPIKIIDWTGVFWRKRPPE